MVFLPYSKEIDTFFDLVKPLVARGTEVLQTIKYISIFLVVYQIIQILFFALILAAMLGLLISVNPDLEYERQQLVTPTMKWIVGRVARRSRWKNSIKIKH